MYEGELMLSHGSLFTGIGGIDLGFERVGIQTKWQVEVEPYAIRVLEKHWPDVERYGDITKINSLPYVDIISGGFPCQDISIAGKGAGIVEGETRSGLWYEMLRIVRAVRPRYVVVENVPMLLNRGMGVVLGGLAEAGYDAEWRVVSAKDVGANHLRKRIFIVAVANDPGLQGHRERPRIFDTVFAQETLGMLCGRNRSELWGRDPADVPDPERPGTPRQREDTTLHRNGRTSLQPNGVRTTEEIDAGGNGGGGRSEAMADTKSGEPRQQEAGNGREDTGGGGEEINLPNAERQRGRSGNVRGDGLSGYASIPQGQRTDHREGTDINASGWWGPTQPRVGRVAHGIPKRVDRLRCLGNAVVPQVAEFIGGAIMEYEKKLKQLTGEE